MRDARWCGTQRVAAPDARAEFVTEFDSVSAGDRKRARRAALAGGVGTLIEYYDFSLYGYLAVVTAPLYFPSDQPVTSLLSALAVFGTAYLVPPSAA